MARMVSSNPKTPKVINGALAIFAIGAVLLLSTAMVRSSSQSSGLVLKETEFQSEPQKLPADAYQHSRGVSTIQEPATDDDITLKYDSEHLARVKAELAGLSAKGNQQGVDEYSLVVDTILRSAVDGAPPNFLVFGTGRDTPVWENFTTGLGGSISFLEALQEWVDFAAKNSNASTVYKVTYTTQLSDIDKLLAMPEASWHDKFWLQQIPAEVCEVPWNTIMVDAPQGWLPPQPGRFQSVYSALRIALARPVGFTTSILLHDCNRSGEERISALFLGEYAKRVGIKKLSLYYIQGQGQELKCMDSR